MSEGGTGVRQSAKRAIEQAKQKIGIGHPPLATEVGGRVEAVRESLRAFGDGDIDRFLSVFAEDVKWVAPEGANFPGAGTREGQASIREHFVETVQRSYASFGFEPRRYLDAPEENWVVVLGAFAGEGVKAKGQFDAPAVQVWEFDGDTVVRVQIYTDAEAFPAPVSEEEAQEEERGSAEGDGQSATEDSTSAEGDGQSATEDSTSAEGDGQSATGESGKAAEGHGETATGESRTSAEGDGGSAPGDERKSAEAERERSEAKDNRSTEDKGTSAERKEGSADGEHSGDGPRHDAAGSG